MVILSAIILAVIAARFYTFGVFLIPISKTFNWSRGALSWASSAASVVAGIESIFVARVSDRYGPRAVVTIAGVLHTAGFFLAAQVSQLWQIYLVWGLIMGTGNACGYIPIMSSIARWFSLRRTTAIGITIAGFAAGAVFWPPFTQWMIDTLDWQRAFMVLGAISAVGILPLAQFLKSSPESIGVLRYGQQPSADASQASPAAIGLTLSQAAKTARFWLWGAILFGFYSSLNVLYVHVVAHARDIGIPPVIAAATLSIIAGTSIAARLTIGSISDRIGTKAALTAALVLAVTAFTLLVSSQSRWAFYLFAVVFALSYGSVVPLETAVPAGLFGASSLGAIMAAAGLLSTLGGAFGPPVAGIIFDRTGEYQPAFIICLGLAAIALVLSLILLRLKEQSAPDAKALQRGKTMGYSR